MRRLSQKSPESHFLIPVTHQVRDRLQPESSIVKELKISGPRFSPGRRLFTILSHDSLDRKMVCSNSMGPGGPGHQNLTDIVLRPLISYHSEIDLYRALRSNFVPQILQYSHPGL